MITLPLTKPYPPTIERARAKIENRATVAGVRFDSADILALPLDGGDVLVWLRWYLTPEPVLNVDGNATGDYVLVKRDTLVIEHYPTSLTVKHEDDMAMFTASRPMRLRCSAPWAVIVVAPNGEMRDGGTHWTSPGSD